MPPRVHNIPLAEYRNLMDKKVRESRRPMTWFFVQPMDRYTLRQLAAMLLAGRLSLLTIM